MGPNCFIAVIGILYDLISKFKTGGWLLVQNFLTLIHRAGGESVWVCYLGNIFHTKDVENWQERLGSVDMSYQFLGG